MNQPYEPLLNKQRFNAIILLIKFKVKISSKTREYNKALHANIS